MMNLDIFTELYSEGHADYLTWESALYEDKPIVAVLTLHLMCENFLEAWICAHINILDLFKEDVKEKKGKIKFSMNFNNKLIFAQRLGLPIEAYKAIYILNQIRNRFAHRLSYNTIEDSQIQSILIHINSIKCTSITHDVQQESVTMYSESGKVKKLYLFTDTTTPNTVKLTIMYGFLIRKLISNFR